MPDEVNTERTAQHVIRKSKLISKYVVKIQILIQKATTQMAQTLSHALLKTLF